MRGRLSILVLGALLLAGCGGGSGKSVDQLASAQVAAGASLVPADVVAFGTVTTDFDSDQIKKADALLQQFPGRERLLTELRKQLADSNVDFDRDLKPALGSEIDLAAFGFDNQNLVGLAATKDQDKFVELLKRGQDAPKVIEKRSDGWVVFGDSQAAVSRIGADGPKLADSQAFKDATATLPGDPLAMAYFDGKALAGQLSTSTGGEAAGAVKLDWVAAALEAQDDGARLKVAAKGDSASAPATYAPDLLDHIPAGSLLFASFKDVDQTLQKALAQAGAASAQFEQQLGVPLADVVGLFSGEGALYVREGLPIPEVTLLLDAANSARKLATLQTLARKAIGLAGGSATFRTTTIGGQPFSQVSVGGIFSIYFGKSEDHIVVTDSTNAITGGVGKSLADDQVFKDAKAAAGMPDETSGFVYVNLKDAIPAIERLAGSAIPPDVSANLRPLRTVLGYAAPDGDVTTFDLFVQIG